MLQYDQHPSQRRDAIAQRQAMLDTITDYRFTAPYKIAADERREREMARAALSGWPIRTSGAARAWLAPARRRLGAALVALGAWLQRDTAGLDPQPET